MFYLIFGSNKNLRTFDSSFCVCWKSYNTNIPNSNIVGVVYSQKIFLLRKILVYTHDFVARITDANQKVNCAVFSHPCHNTFIFVLVSLSMKNNNSRKDTKTFRHHLCMIEFNIRLCTYDKFCNIWYGKTQHWHWAKIWSRLSHNNNNNNCDIMLRGLFGWYPPFFMQFSDYIDFLRELPLWWVHEHTTWYVWLLLDFKIHAH